MRVALLSLRATLVVEVSTGETTSSFLCSHRSGKSESNVGIPHRVSTRTPATQAVTIRCHTSIRHISAERVDHELAPVYKVGHRACRGPAGIGNLARRIESEQHLSRPCVSGIEFSISLAKENQITGNKHTRFRRLRYADLPDHFPRPCVSGSIQAEWLCTGNVVEEGRAQVQISVDRLGHKTCVAGMSLEDIRVMPRAVVDEFCPWAKSCWRPFASSVVARHN